MPRETSRNPSGKNGEKKHKPARGRHVLPKLPVNTLGSLLIPHSVRIVLLKILPYRLSLTLTVSTHPFPETKSCQVEFLG